MIIMMIVKFDSVLLDTVNVTERLLGPVCVVCVYVCYNNDFGKGQIQMKKTDLQT